MRLCHCCRRRIRLSMRHCLLSCDHGSHSVGWQIWHHGHIAERRTGWRRTVWHGLSHSFGAQGSLGRCPCSQAWMNITFGRSGTHRLRSRYRRRIHLQFPFCWPRNSLCSLHGDSVWRLCTLASNLHLLQPLREVVRVDNSFGRRRWRSLTRATACARSGAGAALTFKRLLCQRKVTLALLCSQSLLQGSGSSTSKPSGRSSEESESTSSGSAGFVVAMDAPRTGTTGIAARPALAAPTFGSVARRPHHSLHRSLLRPRPHHQMLLLLHHSRPRRQGPVRDAFLRPHLLLLRSLRRLLHLHHRWIHSRRCRSHQNHRLRHRYLRCLLLRHALMCP